MNVNNYFGVHKQKGRRPKLNKWIEEFFGV